MQFNLKSRQDVEQRILSDRNDSIFYQFECIFLSVRENEYQYESIFCVISMQKWSDPYLWLRFWAGRKPIINHSYIKRVFVVFKNHCSCVMIVIMSITVFPSLYFYHCISITVFPSPNSHPCIHFNIMKKSQRNAIYRKIRISQGSVAVTYFILYGVSFKNLEENRITLGLIFNEENSFHGVF